LINSTIGLLGFVDVASHLYLEKYGEDFGQTLGYWGMGSGPYLVLPFFGPKSVRDAFGLAVDWQLDPVNEFSPDEWKWGLHILRAIDNRADLLAASNVLDQAALDEYTFVRDAYLQKRENDVRDGRSTAVEGATGEEDPVDW
jgi:phospholipid-binding lipoprotein MlaA